MSDTPKTDNLCLDLDDGFARQSDLIAFARDLERENAVLRLALEDCIYFADNSEGIAGWHLKGEVLPWDQIEAIDKARAALAQKEAQP